MLTIVICNGIFFSLDSMFYSPRQALCSGFIIAVPLKTDILCRRKQSESIPNESKWLNRRAESYCRAVGGEKKQQNRHLG